MDMEILDVCQKGETITISFSGTVWYVSLKFTVADVRKFAKLLNQAYSDLEKLIAQKETPKQLLTPIKKKEGKAINEHSKLTTLMAEVVKSENNSVGNTSKSSHTSQTKNLEANINVSAQTVTKLNIIPVRVQRKRTKGFNLQKASPNGLPVVYVGRPTKWGNPYTITSVTHLEDSLILYRQWLESKLKDHPSFLDPLKGKDLACWCPLKDKNGNSVPCHADIILKVMKERGMS